MDGKLMVTPGPTEVSVGVLRAMVRPSIAHYDPEFNEGILVETLDRLQEIYQTENEVILFPGSGRVALESCISSVIEPGDLVLTVTAGIFGRWMKEMVERVGGETIEFEVEWGRPIELSELRKTFRDREFDAFTMVHNESTTGSTYQLEEISDLLSGTDTLFMVDTVSSLAGMDINTDELGIDLNMSAVHKCLGTPPGISFAAISEEAWQKMESRESPCTSFSYDLLRWKKMWIPKSRGGELIFGWRRQPITVPTHAVYALHKASEDVLEEGLKERFNRHRNAAAAFREGIKHLGLSLYPDEKVASDTLTGIEFPSQISATEIKERLLRDYNIMVGGGMEELKGKVIRVAHMNLTARKTIVLQVLQALGSCVSEYQKVDINKSIKAAERVYDN